VAVEWLEVVKFKMDKKTFWIVAGILIAILLIVVIWQTAKINAIVASGEVIKSASSAATSAASSSGMVGGC